MKSKLGFRRLVFILFWYVIPSSNALNLDQAVRAALETNPSISVDEAAARASVYDIDAARAGYFPTVDIVAPGGRQQTRINQKQSSFSGPFKAHATRWTTNPFFVASQNIFDIRVPLEVNRAHQAEQAALSTLGQTRETIAFNAVRAYVEVYAQRKLLIVAEKNIEKHKDLLEKVKKRVEGGVSTMADVYQVESRLEESIAIKEQIIGQLEVARATFQEVIGFLPDELDDPRLPKDEVFTCSLDQVLCQVFQKNPGIVLATAQLNVAEAVFDETISPFIPTVRAETSANAPVVNADGIRGKQSTYTAQLVVDYNLFRGGGNLAERRAQRERVVQAKKQLAVSRRGAEQQSRSAWETVISSRKQAKELSAAIQTDGELERAYLIQFQLVERPLVDLLNAYVTTYRDETDYINARAVEIINHALLLASMGNLTKEYEMPCPRKEL